MSISRQPVECAGPMSPEWFPVTYAFDLWDANPITDLECAAIRSRASSVEEANEIWASICWTRAAQACGLDARTARRRYAKQVEALGAPIPAKAAHGVAVDVIRWIAAYTLATSEFADLYGEEVEGTPEVALAAERAANEMVPGLDRSTTHRALRAYSLPVPPKGRPSSISDAAVDAMLNSKDLPYEYLMWRRLLGTEKRTVERANAHGVESIRTLIAKWVAEADEDTARSHYRMDRRGVHGKSHKGVGTDAEIERSQKLSAVS